MSDADAATWTGGVVSPRVRCVLAPNASPMTLEGTNTWVLAEPGSTRSVVVDPGPLDADHLAAVLAAATDGGRSVATVLATHRHADHVEGAQAFGAMADAPVRAADPAFQYGPGESPRWPRVTRFASTAWRSTSCTRPGTRPTA